MDYDTNDTSEGVVVSSEFRSDPEHYKWYFLVADFSATLAGPLVILLILYAVLEVTQL